MVASYSPPVSASSWRPTARTLGALFAGSAVMFASTAVNGDSLLLAGDEAEPITEPAANPAGAGQDAFATSPSAPVSGPGQAAPWTPGAAPQWGSSLGDLPVRRAPVQEAPRQKAPAASIEVASVGPAASRSSAAGPAASRRTAGGASTGNAGSGKPAPQSADSRHAGPVDGVLGGVIHVANGLSH